MAHKTMGYPPSETSSDLEWMLQSGQANSTELAEALLSEFYVPVYRLSLYLLEDPAAAGSTTPDAFIAALLNAYAYRSTTGVRLWLFDLALKTSLEKRRKLRPGLSFIGSIDDEPSSSSPPSAEDIRTWSALDGLDYRPRIIAFLYFALDLNASEIAGLLHFKEGDVLAGLEAAIGRLAPERASFNAALTDDFLFSRLSQSLKAHWPAPELSQADLARLASRIAEHGERGEARRRRRGSLNEIVLVGVIILVAIGLTWRVNQYMPELQPTPYTTVESSNVRVPTRTNVIYFVQKGDTLDSIATKLGMPVSKLVAINAISTADPLYSGEPLWVDVSAGLDRDPTPVTPPPPVAPLTLNSSDQAIRERLNQSAFLWNTLYADIQYYPNGPTSTAGLHNLYRDQIWVSQPGQSMEVFGLPNDEIFLRRIATNGRGYTFPAGSGEAYIDNDWFPGTNGLLRNPQLQAMLFPGRSGWSQPVGNFKPVASETIAGRPSLVVEWVNPLGLSQARLWIDAITGVILRRQFFQGNEIRSGPDKIISEIAVSTIVYDVGIPARLFDPEYIWQGGFARDYTGDQASK